MEAGVGVVRLIRALAFTAACLVLTVGAHVLGGGQTSVLAVGALVLVCWPAALLASSRRLGTASLSLGLGAGQVTGHLLLTWLGHGAASSSMARCLSMGQRLMHTGGTATGCEHRMSGASGGHATQVKEMSGLGASAVTDHAMTAMGAPSMTMALMHVLAVGVLAYLLARGESVLWRVLNAVMPRMLQPTLRVRSVPVPAVSLPAPLHRHLLLVVPRRGPPMIAS